MHVKNLSTTLVAITMGTCVFSAQANDNNWSPNQPADVYWQAPNEPAFNMSPGYNPVAPRYNNNRPPQGYWPPQPVYNYPAPNNQRPNYTGQNYPGPYNRPAQNMNLPSNRPSSQTMATPPMQNNNTGYPPPPPGPYNSGSQIPDNGASAYNTPGYNPYRNNRSNRGWNNNKFWGRSGPGTWMNPNKNTMENGWDDMINAPSRMGEMPGGWSAPEVSMPNPVDMGDQIQDNVKDLPDQVRNMDVGND
ncbi:MAG: hypothetical protein RQ982_08375 [Gammaproteobacteria bacterium]|nr:hypothetical protein [Gammaproteobacteria bacterium]